MIKRFCDVCGIELNSANTMPETIIVKRKPKKSTEIEGLNVVLRVVCNGPKGDYCRSCVFDTINTQDDRPRSV